MLIVPVCIGQRQRLSLLAAEHTNRRGVTDSRTAVIISVRLYTGRERKPKRERERESETALPRYVCTFRATPREFREVVPSFILPPHRLGVTSKLRRWTPRAPRSPVLSARFFIIFFFLSSFLSPYLSGVPGARRSSDLLRLLRIRTVVRRSLLFFFDPPPLSPLRSISSPAHRKIARHSGCKVSILRTVGH